MAGYGQNWAPSAHAVNGIAGANFKEATAEQHFPLGLRTADHRGVLWEYVQAAAAVSAGATLGVDASGTTEAGGTSHYAPVAIPESYFSWIKVTDEPGDDTVIPFYGISANGADAAVVTIVAPFDGVIRRIDTVLLGGALTTGNATVTAAIGGTAVTGGVVTIAQSGSAAGDKDSATPTAANAFAVGDTITLTVGGSAAGDRTLNGFVTLERT